MDFLQQQVGPGLHRANHNLTRGPFYGVPFLTPWGRFSSPVIMGSGSPPEAFPAHPSFNLPYS